jgi:hypothetical protein
MRGFRCWLLFFACGIVPASLALADDTQTALNEIEGFAEHVCQTAPPKSTSNDFEISGAANAELKGLVTKIAGLGINGAAKYKSEQTEGVLQKDLAPLLVKSADCKERVAMKLIDKLLAPTPQKSSSSAPAHDPDTVYQRGLPVGHVTGADPRENESAVYFAAIKDTQSLDRNREFQYRKWVLRLVSMRSSAGVALTSQGPEMAVLDAPVCKIVRLATNPDEP